MQPLFPITLTVICIQNKQHTEISWGKQQMRELNQTERDGLLPANPSGSH